MEEKARQLKRDKTTSLVQTLAANFIARESAGQSLITVTHCELSPDRRYIKILVSVLPKERGDQAIDFLTRNRQELREYLKENSRMRIIPSISFVLQQ